MRTASKPVKASDNAKAIVGAPVVVDKSQEDFNEAAGKLSVELGWAGDGDNVLKGIQVLDAFNYLRKAMHQNYVHGLFPDKARDIDADEVAAHLGIGTVVDGYDGEAEDDEERMAILRAAFNEPDDAQ